MNIRDLVFSGDLRKLGDVLRARPDLANKEISLPGNSATAHPLHRICDGVCCGYYDEEKGLEIAKLFVNCGAQVNPETAAGKDSPLTAACSLRCDQLAIFYLQQGARIDHRGCHGGTALHWASWCGRDAVVANLVKLNPVINQLCLDFKSTPLFWAIHGYRFGGEGNRHHQFQCAQMLCAHGADRSIPNFEGHLPVQLIDGNDKEFLELLQDE